MIRTCVRVGAVFLAVALADALWARWMLATSLGHAVLAGFYSAGLVLSGAFVTVAYIKDRRYLIPALLGAFVGTYLSVRYA